MSYAIFKPQVRPLGRLSALRISGERRGPVDRSHHFTTEGMRIHHFATMAANACNKRMAMCANAKTPTEGDEARNRRF
jgi:hypothetical protein